MTSNSQEDKKMAQISQKLQQDVDLILENFLGFGNDNDLFEVHLNVDAILKSKIPPRTAYRLIHNKPTTPKVHKHHTVRRIDSKLNIIEPHFYKETVVRSEKKSSLLKKIFWF